MSYTTISTNLDDVAAGNVAGTGNHHKMGSVGAGYHVTRLQVDGEAAHVPLNNPSTTLPFGAVVVAGLQWVPFGATPASIIGSPDSAGMLYRAKIMSTTTNVVWQTGSTTWQEYGSLIRVDLRMQWTTPESVDIYFSTASDEGATVTKWLLYAESRITYA